jgi:hypothetical protein
MHGLPLSLSFDDSHLLSLLLSLPCVNHITRPCLISFSVLLFFVQQQEAARVLCLLARYAACPSVQEDYLTGAILSLLENLCDPSCDPLLKLVCSVLFSSLSNFELREESLSERAISLIDRCQTVISGLNLSGSDSQETTKLAIGCLELLGSCAQASPSCCIKVANVALSCLASRKLLERVVDVLVTAVTSDSPPKPRQSSNPCMSSCTSTALAFANLVYCVSIHR